MIEKESKSAVKERKNPKAVKIKCDLCGAKLQLRADGQSVTIMCQACGSIDVTFAKAVYLVSLDGNFRNVKADELFHSTYIRKEYRAPSRIWKIFPKKAKKVESKKVEETTERE